MIVGRKEKAKEEPQTPTKFIKPAELFMLRKVNRQSLCFDESSNQGQTVSSSSSHSSSFFNIDSQSPLKCLHNLSDPSPTKKLPVLLRNPFNKPVKRQLKLTNSPSKRSRMLAVDEDANLEPPKSRLHCPHSDWILLTKLRIDLQPGQSDTKRLQKLLELAATFYQHPYLPWDPLFPRADVVSERKDLVSLKFSPELVAETMYADWCKTFDDLLDQLSLGRCPYFYLCSNFNTLLFRRADSSMKVLISPIKDFQSQKFDQLGIKFECPQVDFSPISQTTQTTQTTQTQTRPHSQSDMENFDQLDDVEDPKDKNLDQIFSQINTLKSGRLDENSRPLALVSDKESIQKLVKLIKTNINPTSLRFQATFSCIPPTLIAPRQFRQSTARCPTIKVAATSESGSTFIEIQGPVLPSIHVNIHELLIRNNFKEHQCSRKILDSSKSFKFIGEAP